jgi:prepilin-type N-terminal cleavage/methylation domain-containing protein/prepilin-type processing-associated H-X9-DG protein
MFKEKRTGFSLIELLVVIAIIALLMGILMPALQRVKSQAQEMACRANLRQYGIAQTIYLDDFDDKYPDAWTSLVMTEEPVAGYQRYCRWHDPRYPADGPFWPYLKEEKVHLCPTFKVLARTYGQGHPSHDKSIPVVPYYSYSMNFFLSRHKRSEFTRRPSEIFFFSEENMWTRPPVCIYVLNDNALCGDGRDWFGTFHGMKGGDLDSGTVNAVFVDAHVEQVRSALGEDQTDKSQMEQGKNEKFAWPYKIQGQ